MLPKISVVIPNYNRTTVLQRSIRSAIGQAYPNLEIIVIDDDSSVDPTPYITAIEDSRIRLVRLDKNGGAAHARNKGAALATGKYIAFLDSDDEWMPGYLKRRMDILLGQKLDGCYGAVLKFNAGTIIDAPPVRLPLEGESMATYLISGTLRAATPSLVIRRMAFLDIKFDENLIVHEDYDMLIRFSQKYSWACDQAPGVKVHLSDTGLSARFDFPSSIRFLKRHAATIGFKWLMFYCFRKIALAQEKKQESWTMQYIKILDNNILRANFFTKVNFFLFKRFSSLYLSLFQNAVACSYQFRKFYSRILK